MLPLDRALLDRATALVDSLNGARLDRVEALAGLDTSGLLTAIGDVGGLARVVDAFGAVLCAEVTRRVQTDARFRREALGGEVGGKLPDELLRDTFRVADDTLRDWNRVAEAITPRVTLQGEVLPSRHEPLADAVLAGEVTACAGAIVARGIDRVSDHGTPDELAAAETMLLEFSTSLTTRALARASRALADRLDPDGAEPREELQRRRAGVTVRQTADGMTRLIADLHPEGAGFVLTALGARTSLRRGPRFIDEHGGDDDDALNADLADARPLRERRVDALVAIARESIAADKGTVGGTSVTMLVTIPLETLKTGVGTAAIAGVDEPISAGTARRLAAGAEIIPAVLGGHSEVLDLGRCERLYTEAQRRALAIRDEGCI